MKLLLTDILVLGGGAAGIAAASAAADAGLDVTLVEKNGYAGGKATAAEVGTICGLYRFSFDDPDYIVKGFAREFAEELRTRSGTKPLSNASGLHYLPYHIDVFKQYSFELLKEKDIRLFFHSHVTAVTVAEKQVTAVFIHTQEEGEIEIRPRMVVDCTGESTVARLADLAVIRSDHYQAAAQVFTLQGIKETHEGKLGLILLKELRLAIQQGKLDHYFDRVYVVQGSLHNGTVSLKIGIPVPVTYCPGNLDALRASAFDFIQRLTTYLKEHAASFKEISIEHIAPEVGIRVGQRTRGRYVLTEEDVLGCKKFPDAIADCGWPIEEWEQDRRVHMRYFEPEEFYQVPARCLRADGIDNLYMGGRNISATDGAIASARVIGICLQTGYAAGRLAAAQLQGTCPNNIIEEIQNGAVYSS
ncbi:FAD-dependent oxidoreductase [Nostoc ellipsosporum NOK]|nr:FAD-dependent oxidoreductase [Nostoc ellipsosporum NOK]